MTVTDIVVQTQPSALEWIAAGATVLSAGVIAWQAWLTRRSVQASDRAVEVAQAALTESQLARIESGVPRLTVTTNMLFADQQLWRIRDNGSDPVNEDDVFKLPRDADVRLWLSHGFTVRNDGPGTVIPRISWGTSIWSNPDASPLPPGAEKHYSFVVSHTVSEWVDLLKTSYGEDMRTVFPVAGKIYFQYAGPRDSDVDEMHVVVVRGSALVAVDDAKGDWRRANGSDHFSSLKAEVEPATRTYWRSRSAKVEFDTAPIADGGTSRR